MAGILRINKKLERQFGKGITAREKDGHLLLQGSLNRWEDIVQAGYLGAKHNPFQGLVNDIKWTGGTRQPVRLPSLADTSLENTPVDVLVIGAGVTGCAIARQLARYRLKVLLVDKEYDVGLHASSRNDGMVHPGIDLRKSSRKHRFNTEGNAMYDRMCQELGVEFKRWGQVLGFSAKLQPLLYLTLPYWKWLGVPAKVLNKRQLRQAEPHLNPVLGCGLSFPTAGSVCPYGLTIALAENAVENGVQLSLDTAVLGMEVAKGRIKSVQTNRGTLHPRLVINAAGTYADEIARLAGDQFYSIHPRKGTNSITD